MNTNLIPLGRVLGTWGLEGAVVVRLFNGDYLRGNLAPLQRYENLFLDVEHTAFLRSGGEEKETTTLQKCAILWVKVISKKIVIKFLEITDVTQAGLLQNAQLLVAREEIVKVQKQLEAETEIEAETEAETEAAVHGKQLETGGAVNGSSGSNDSNETNNDSNKVPNIVSTDATKNKEPTDNIFLVSDFIGVSVFLQSGEKKLELGVIGAYYPASSDGVFELNYGEPILQQFAGKKGYEQSVFIPASLEYFEDLDVTLKSVRLKNYEQLLLPYVELGF